MVENIIKSDSVTTTAIGKLFGDDGAYDGNDVFRCLWRTMEYCALLYQSKKKNAKIRWKKERNILRNLSVISQKKDLQAWKDSSVSYGNRWIVETVFSCLKRTFGEHVYSVKLKIRYRR